MGVLHVNPTLRQRELTRALYQGDIALFIDVRAVSDLVWFVRDELCALYAPHDPEEAHEHFDPTEMAAMLARFKPKFIHDPRSKLLIKRIMDELGFDPHDTYLDVPKLRTAFPSSHLTTGIAYAFPWHRDSWYGAPAQQINWWLPVYEVRPDNAMMFSPDKFGVSVDNDSDQFDYYAANRDRLTTAAQVKVEKQVRPRALDHEPADPLIVLPAPGSIMAFAGAQLHATIPNTSGRSRYSVDFRTVDLADVNERVGADLGDTRCAGTALRDFVNSDGTRIDEDLVRELYGTPPSDALLVFDRDVSLQAAHALRISADDESTVAAERA